MSFRTPTLWPGTHRLTIDAVDAAGNHRTQVVPFVIPLFDAAASMVFGNLILLIIAMVYIIKYDRLRAVHKKCAKHLASHQR
jgi:hypothetical protein